MTREIKFRGKIDCTEEELSEILEEYKVTCPIDEKGWIYGNLINGKTPYIVGEVIDSFYEGVNLEYWYPVKKNTIGQYTGLKDKNGKEIFEGDIVLVKRYDVLSTSWNSEIENEKKILIMSRVGYVAYDELRLSFRVKSPIGNQTIALSGVGYFDYDIEVIGNIYENKKLLDVK